MALRNDYKRKDYSSVWFAVALVLAAAFIVVKDIGVFEIVKQNL